MRHGGFMIQLQSNFFRSKALTLVIALATFGMILFLSACEEGDDQAKIPIDRLEAVNPTPIKRDFKKINAQHEILLAVVDTGTDYNHPKLLENMHFELGAHDIPTGVGYDYIAGDTWPAPYLAVTVDQNADASNDAIEEGKNVVQRLTQAQTLAPKAADFLNPMRRVDQEEDSGAYHGTHVAGLMTYDDPRLGLISYRILPHNIKFKNKARDTAYDTRGVFFQRMKASLEDAIQKGARVINLSLAMGDVRKFSDENSTEFQKQSESMIVLEELTKANPKVAFVAAAGNEGSWVDRRSRLQLPCGLNSQNVLCVGAADLDGGLASFSNLVLMDTPYIVAPGEKILSLYPSLMCSDGTGISALSFLKSKETGFPWSSPEDTQKAFQKLEMCAQSTGMTVLSGTSMASPITARLLAKLLIKNPSLSGSQAIQELLKSGEEVTMGPLKFKKLWVEKPSWYAKEPWTKTSKNDESYYFDDSSNYFEFYTR